MELSTHNQTMPKRKRIISGKRWTRAEECELIEFLMENRNFEKPTARMYYEPFARWLSVEWNTVRDKVRNMRIRYNKAKKFEASAGVLNMEALQKVFTYFNEFDEIFGSREWNYDYLEQQESVQYTVMNSGSLKVEEENEMEMPVETVIGFEPEDENNSELGIEAEVQIKAEAGIEAETGIESEFGIEEHMASAPKVESPTQDKTTPHRKRMGTSISDILRAQEEIIELKRMKLHRDAQFKLKELSLKEKELEIRRRELKLKEREIRGRFELEKLELEMQETIATEELYIKFFSM